MAKKRIVIDYEKLPVDIINRIKLEYPEGFEDNLITFTNSKGLFVSALPFETEDIYYLIRMTEQEAQQIIEDDDDYDEDGKLRNNFEEDVNEDEEEYLDDNLAEDKNMKSDSCSV